MKKRVIWFVLVLTAFMPVLSACSREDDNGKKVEPVKKSDVSIYDVAFDFRDKDSFDKTTAIIVDGRHIFVSELMWHLYQGMKNYKEFIESTDVEDTQRQAAGDEVIRSSIRKAVYYDHYYNKCSDIKPSRTDEQFAEEYEKVLETMPKKDADEFGLTKEGYIALARKYDVTAQYEQRIKQDLEIDIDKVIAENPAEKFKPDIRVELLSVSYTKKDAEGNEEPLSNEEIEKQLAKINDIYKKIETEKPDSLEKYADEESGISFKVCSYSEDENDDRTDAASSQLGSYLGLVKKELEDKEAGYVSKVLESPIGACIVKRLEPDFEGDYKAFIVSQVPVLKEKAYEEMVEKELEGVKVQINDRVFEQLDPDEILNVL